MLLAAEDITKIYTNGGRELKVLDGVNVSFEKGEVVAIVGPSGAGKSTLLHILGGLDAPTRGEVIFDGQPFSSLGEARRDQLRCERFGFVFQFYHLLAEFSALENVSIPALIRRGAGATAGVPATAGRDKKKIHEKASLLLERVGLADRRRHKPSELSGGEQQRVAVARALMNDPQVLFCDEPTGNLDHKNGLEIFKILQDLNRHNSTTVVLVTHGTELAQGAHRILHILDGKLEA